LMSEPLHANELSIKFPPRCSISVSQERGCKSYFGKSCRRGESYHIFFVSLDNRQVRRSSVNGGRFEGQWMAPNFI
jgi:hypothetical protein